MYLHCEDEKEEKRFILNAVILPRPLDGASDQQSHSWIIYLTSCENEEKKHCHIILNLVHNWI